MECKKAADNIIDIDKRVTKLEHSHEHDFKFMHEQLDKIEKRVNDIANSLQSIRDQFNNYNGMHVMKSRFINSLYMIATLVVALIANDFIVRKIFEG